MNANDTDRRLKSRGVILLLSVSIIAICAIVYELGIGSLSSYLLGNSVYQFSITIGLFMTAMGIGSYLSKYITRQLITAFIRVELVIGVHWWLFLPYSCLRHIVSSFSTCQSCGF